MHTKNQLIISIFITAVIFGLLGFYGAKITGKTPVISPQAKNNPENTCQAGWDPAGQKLEETGLIMPGEIMGINGIIEKIEGNKITLNAGIINPLQDEGLKTRIVTINEDTKIFLRKERTIEEIKAEEAERKRKISPLKEQQKLAATEEAKMEIEMQIMELDMPVEMFIEEKAGVEDLREGDGISVTASEDIKDKKEFSAVRITINKNLAISPEEAIIEGEAPLTN